MTYLLIFLFAIACSLLIGYGMARYAMHGNNLSRIEKKELEHHRDFMSDLGAKAAEHAMLGDNFAVIVQGMLSDERKRR